MDGETDFSYGPADGYAEGEEPVVFHHKDGEFRKYEKKEYSDLATGKSAPKTGIFKVLVSTKMNRMIFLAMVVTFGVVIIISIFASKQNEDHAGGVFCSLSAFSFGEDVYVSIGMKKYSKKDSGSEYPKKVSFVVTAVNSDGADAYSEALDFDFQGSGGEETCRLAIPNYEMTKVRVSVSCGGESKELSCKIVQK